MAKAEKPKVSEDKILDLDELVEPVGQFRVGGGLYEFVEMGALGLLAQREIEKKWELIQMLRKLAKPKKDQQETYERAIRQLIVLTSNMPKDTAKVIELSKLLQALICFFSFRTASQVALVVRMAQIAGKDGQLTGASSSLGSIVSGQSPTQ
jgi:hypothetical protein